MKISIKNILISPFSIFADNFINFVKISIIYATILTLFSYFLGTPYACVYTQGQETFFKCSTFGYGMFFYQVVKLVLLSSFIKNWGLVSSKNQKPNFLPERSDAKIFAVSTLCSICLILPIISFYFLYIREPNPNWKIELLYFLFVSAGIWAPLFLIRFFPIIGASAINDKLPSIKESWKGTQNNTWRIFIFIFILAITSLILLSNVMQGFIHIKDNFTLANVLFSDFVYNMLILLILAIFINHCIILNKFIKGDK